MIHRRSLAGLRNPLTCLGAGIAAGILLLAGVRPAAGQAQGSDESVLAAIRTRLEATIVAGYAERDAAKIVSIYSKDAKIIGFIMGVGDVSKAHGYIERDLALHREASASIQELALVGLEGGVATVSFRLPMRLVTTAGDESVVRNDIFFMKLRFEEGQWRGFLQSYRPDFGESNLPHNGPSGEVVTPHQAPPPEHPAKGTTDL